MCDIVNISSAVPVFLDNTLSKCVRFFINTVYLVLNRLDFSQYTVCKYALYLFLRATKKKKMAQPG